jgi:DNA-directed RNA polymerase specialized sigma subunit
MEEKIVLSAMEPYVKKLSGFYSWKFIIDKDDLYQEGMLALLIASRKYSNLEETALRKVLKRVVNRSMYAFIKKEKRLKERFINTEGGIYYGRED